MNLYVSDLDGTLLNSNKVVSNYSKNILNNLIKKGVLFTVATARTPGTINNLLSGLNISIPAVLMNGVIIYDMKNKEYLDFKDINKEAIKQILNIVEINNKNIFLYTIEENKLNVYYKNLDLEFDNNYYKERVVSKYKTFIEIDSYRTISEEKDVVNIVIMDKPSVIKEIYNQIKDIKGIYVNYSQDIYDKECYFLEIHSDLASKARGIKELSKYIKYDELICFGDNTNDISMFKVAHRAYAMGNSVDELKKIATKVIESNNEDAVANFVNSENNF